MDYCIECDMKFTDDGLRTGAQRVTGHGHKRFPKLQYCPECKRTYDLIGNPLSLNGSSAVYFDEDYVREDNGVVCFGRIVTDKNDFSKSKR